MKKMRVLVLVREGLIPPDTLDGHSEKEIAEWKVEFDVISTLKEMRHQVGVLVLAGMGLHARSRRRAV